MQKTAVDIVKKLQEAGHTAYFAGGCVRDLLLKKEPKDYDIATSARPEEIEDLFEQTYPIGKAFGVITTVVNGFSFEIATFRSDSTEGDGRRPDAVYFSHPAEDAFRRDFTINGLFYDPIYEEVHDFVGGQDDLKNQLIRFIRVPHERIQEDHLRILRAIRFKNTFGFSYHPDTYEALRTHANLANRVSQERVRDEFNKILMSGKAAEAFEDMQDLGVLKEVFPELEACKGVAQPPEFHREGDVWNHTMKSLASLSAETSLLARWAVLFHDIGKPKTFKIKERIRFDRHAHVSAEIAEDVMRRLCFSKKDIEHVTWVVKHHLMMKELLDMPLGRKRHWFLDPRFPDLMILFYADVAGSVPANFKLYDAVKEEYEHTLKAFPERPKPLLSGTEVISLLKLPPGPQIGEILEKMWQAQLSGELDSPESAKQWLLKQV